MKTSNSKQPINRRSNLMDADKLEKNLNFKPLSTRAKHVGRYRRLKIFFALPFLVPLWSRGLAQWVFQFYKLLSASIGRYRRLKNVFTFRVGFGFFPREVDECIKS
jgi:hypothetical protein